MNNEWQQLVERLRNEIAEYGHLLGLFEEQHRLILRRAPEGVLAASREIEGQVGKLDLERRLRTEAVSAFAAAHGEPAGSTLRSLLPHVPAEARPLLKAMIAEVNVLIHRVRRDSRRNQHLLRCVVDCHQELLRRLRPDSFTKTYARDGRVSMAALKPVPAVRQAG